MNRPRVLKACTRGGWTKENQIPVPNPKLVDKSSTCLLGHHHDGNDGRGTVKNMMGKMEVKDNNMRTRGTDGRSLLDLPPRLL